MLAHMTPTETKWRFPRRVAIGAMLQFSKADGERQHVGRSARGLDGNNPIEREVYTMRVPETTGIAQTRLSMCSCYDYSIAEMAPAVKGAVSLLVIVIPIIEMY